jgi:hypothetical protein
MNLKLLQENAATAQIKLTHPSLFPPKLSKVIPGSKDPNNENNSQNKNRQNLKTTKNLLPSFMMIMQPRRLLMVLRHRQKLFSQHLMNL